MRAEVGLWGLLVREVGPGLKKPGQGLGPGSLLVGGPLPLLSELPPFPFFARDIPHRDRVRPNNCPVSGFQQ